MSAAVVLFVALVGGITIALQAQFAGVLDTRMGTLDAITVSFVSGGVVIALTRVAAGGIDTAAWKGAPWWAYLVGVFALVIVGTIGFATPRIGLVPTLATVTVAQFVTSATISHFGWFTAPVERVDVETAIGIVLLCAGGWLVLR